MPKFIEVYATATGRKQLVPEHYIGHPVLGAGISLLPSQRDQAQPEGEPDMSWNRKQLDAYAVTLGLGTTDLATKADVLTAIAAHEPEVTDVVVDESPDVVAGDGVDGTDDADPDAGGEDHDA